MNAMPDPAWGRVDEDAARWVVRKEGANLEPDALAQFDAWYEADPLHAQTYDALAASWRRLDQVSVLPIARKKRRSRVKALASACVLMGASLYAWNMFDQQGAISSGVAITQLSLPDGSIAILDAQTRVRLHFENGQRQVQVESGRAFFQVVPADSQTGPFTVQAGPAQATALGTRYEVSLKDQISGVSVYEHTVQVQCYSCESSQQAILQPGDSATVAGGHLAVQQQADSGQTEAAPSWTNGLLSFDDVSLSEVVRQLGEYTHRVIWIGSDQAGSTRVSGVVQAAKPAAALNLLTLGQGLQIRELPGLIVIY
ncbi:FecR domain-containing protein [Alcaligenes sp. SORT26]|uniref:FecR family protein n=1 Tax=Alcaligenes sp. SORT26 TaxID=2813780 RepID=UPI001A9D1F58|nr:FecR domain-containing protein [Alcaligenes sp. SORT26]QTC00148.1 FecR domain-containing protein [Alcaligenes sp. SORT26]